MLAFAQVPLAGDGTMTAPKKESGPNCSHIVAIGKKIMADKSSEICLSLTNKNTMGWGYSAIPKSSRIRLSSN